VRKNSSRLAEIFQIFQKHNPNPKSELIFANIFQLFVATVLSAQTQDKAVNKVTEKLFPLIPSPQDLLNLGEEKLQKMIASLGLSNRKAKNLTQACEILVRDFQGEIPSAKEQLENLPGVGKKTAAVILNLGFGKTTLAVDTHVKRVSQRLKITTETRPEKIELDLLPRIKKEFQFFAHHWLILHGRYICLARKPKCDQCFLRSLCPSAGKEEKAKGKNKNKGEEKTNRTSGAEKLKS